jgi:hypothetical protein
MPPKVTSKAFLLVLKGCIAFGQLAEGDGLFVVLVILIDIWPKNLSVLCISSYLWFAMGFIGESCPTPQKYSTNPSIRDRTFLDLILV